ncbi:MAG: hypothetical protein RL211_1260 [Pseudomonadota bacterium]|jgi:glycosyltransferase involved in cell wall biosynthesis
MNDLRPIALLLTPVLPVAGVSGRSLRAWDWLQELASTHRVHVLVVDSQAPILPKADPATGVWTVAATTAVTSRGRRALGLLFPPLCLLSRRYLADWVHLAGGDISDDLGNELGREPVERVVVFRLYLHDVALAIARRFPLAALELDMDDLESRTRLSVAGSLLRMGYLRAAARWTATALQCLLVERYCPGPYHKVWLASEQDCQHARTRLAPVVCSRPNRLPMPMAIKAPPEGIIRLLFVGTLNYPPNEEAVLDLLNGVVPELRRRLNLPWRLCVVGRHASAHLTALLATAPEVEFVPNADTMTPWYEASHAVVVPLRSGGGTKLKTLEGFAHRRAVVSTRHGMRGLGAVAGEHYLLAETPAEFAAAITRLAHDHSLSERLAESGRVLFHQHNTANEKAG